MNKRERIIVSVAVLAGVFFVWDTVFSGDDNVAGNTSSDPQQASTKKTVEPPSTTDIDGFQAKSPGSSLGLSEHQVRMALHQKELQESAIKAKIAQYELSAAEALAEKEDVKKSAKEAEKNAISSAIESMRTTLSNQIEQSKNIERRLDQQSQRPKAPVVSKSETIDTDKLEQSISDRVAKKVSAGLERKTTKTTKTTKTNVTKGPEERTSILSVNGSSATLDVEGSVTELAVGQSSLGVNLVSVNAPAGWAEVKGTATGETRKLYINASRSREFGAISPIKGDTKSVNSGSDLPNPKGDKSEQ